MKKKEPLGPDIIEHWYSLHLGLNFSTQYFYKQLEEQIASEEIPNISVTRIDIPTGGVFSEKREYLRIKQERLCFDVCAAPVGVNYFFSYRFYSEPVQLQIWEILTLFIVPSLIFYGLDRWIGTFFALLVILAGIAFVVWVMRSAVADTMRNLDKELMELPVIGKVYERFFRIDSYYRQDIRIAFGSLVGGITKRLVSQITAEKGVKLVREFAYSPLLTEVYKVKEVKPSETAQGG